MFQSHPLPIPPKPNQTRLAAPATQNIRKSPPETGLAGQMRLMLILASHVLFGVHGCGVRSTNFVNLRKVDKIVRNPIGQISQKKLKFSVIYSPLGVGGRQTKHTKAQFSQRQSPLPKPAPPRAKHLGKHHESKANPLAQRQFHDGALFLGHTEKPLQKEGQPYAEVKKFYSFSNTFSPFLNSPKHNAPNDFFD